MKYAPPGNNYLFAYNAGGTVFPWSAGAGATPPGVNLSVSATYYFPWGGEDAPLPGETPLVSLSLEWAAALAGTITFEVTNFPHRIPGGGRGQGALDVSDFSSNVGLGRAVWAQYNPSTLYVPAVAGAGNSITALTLTAGGTNGGGTTIDIGNTGTRRGRVVVVVTTPGRMAITVNAKAGG